jgi:hypothetical protein
VFGRGAMTEGFGGNKLNRMIGRHAAVVPHGSRIHAGRNVPYDFVTHHI